MAKFIFTKNNPGITGTLHVVAQDNANLQAYNDVSYNIINASTDQYNDVRLEKKEVYYDENNNLLFNDTPLTIDSLETLTTIVNSIKEEGREAYVASVKSLKTKDFSTYTFPLTKTLPEIAEEKGVTWVGANEIF
jgi:hypothetical protein|tara:strand:+ start:664 stop:1068 length:405 start_codon:yes stop_codon:yes gene_type:complete